MKRSKRILLIAMMSAVGAICFWFGRITRHGIDEQKRLTQLEQENRELKAAIESQRVLDPPRQGQSDISQTPKDGRLPMLPHKRALSQQEDTEVIRTLRDGLSSATKTVEELQSRITEIQTQLEQALQEQKRLTTAEGALTDQLASAKRLAETKDSELSRKNEQVLQLEAGNKKLRDEAAAAGMSSAQLLQTSNELQELHRRRESYLNALISRYREITEQYRAFISVLENRRGPEGTPGTSVSLAGPELGRIQSSITMAEEDLRQLNTLNAQALRIQKKLSGK